METLTTLHEEQDKEGVFTLMGWEHLRLATAARNRREGSRERRAIRSRMAGCGTPYRKK